MRSTPKIVLIAGILGLIVIPGLIVIVHNERSQVGMETISPLPLKAFDPACLKTLSRSRIFFAHMSVGYNILDGIAAIGQDTPGSPALVETDDPSQMASPGLYHARLGFNGDPAAKIRSFESQVAKIASACPDIVLMKLCYVDIIAGRNARDLFESYRQSMDRLEKQYPDIRFIHCTVPLTSEPTTVKRKIKSAVKSLLGKTTWVHDNTARMEFTTRLRQQYPPDRIFDIAMAESLTPETRLCHVPSGGIQVPVLYRAYTDDGGHLNTLGRRPLAEHFLMTLGESLHSSPKP